MQRPRGGRRGLVLLGGVLTTALLAAGVLVAPVPFVVMERGPTVDVLGSHDGVEVIRIVGTPVTASTGQLRMTTVDVDLDVSLPKAVESWFDTGRALVPQEAVFPADLTRPQVEKRNATQFSTSQGSAETVAEREIGHPVDVTIKLEKIGGPSAGLMFALGIIDKVRPEDLTGGRVIAGTGTIDDAGTVGPIGGIPQKLIGAYADGATFFLVPAANCAEAVRNAVPGLAMISVATLAEALTALRTLAGGGVPTACPVG
jgi:PDZ domain-containing protein